MKATVSPAPGQTDCRGLAAWRGHGLAEPPRIRGVCGVCGRPDPRAAGKTRRVRRLRRHARRDAAAPRPRPDPPGLRCRGGARRVGWKREVRGNIGHARQLESETTVSVELSEYCILIAVDSPGGGVSAKTANMFDDWLRAALSSFAAPQSLDAPIGCPFTQIVNWLTAVIEIAADVHPRICPPDC